MIYDPNTMTKHSLYSNYGRNLLKKMLSSYKSGGGPNFPKASPESSTPPTPPLPSGPPTLMRSGPTTLMPEEEDMGPPILHRSLAWSPGYGPSTRFPTPTPSLPGQPPVTPSYPNRPSEAQLSQDRPRSMRPELSGRGYSLDPSQPRIGGLGEIVKVDTCPDNQDGGYGDEDYRKPEDQRSDKEIQGYDSTFPAADDKKRNINEFNEAMRDYNTFKVQDQNGKGYSLDPSQPRIGGLGEIVKVDTCPDNQLGGDYFIDPSQPAIAGRPEVVGYKPCNHEPPIPDVADATNEIPQEVQDGGMKHVSKFVNSVINKVTGKKDESKVNPEVGVEAVKVVDALPEADVVEDDYFDPAQNHPADPRFL